MGKNEGASTPLPVARAEGGEWLGGQRTGSNRCDSRRDVRETRAAFPGVDFSLIEEGEDSIWADNHQLQPSGGCYPSGEGEYEVMARGVAFVRWLMQR